MYTAPKEYRFHKPQSCQRAEFRTDFEDRDLGSTQNCTVGRVNDSRRVSIPGYILALMDRDESINPVAHEEKEHRRWREQWRVAGGEQASSSTILSCNQSSMVWDTWPWRDAEPPAVLSTAESHRHRDLNPWLPRSYHAAQQQVGVRATRRQPAPASCAEPLHPGIMQNCRASRRQCAR